VSEHLNYKIVAAGDHTQNNRPWAILIHGLFGSLDNLNSLAKSLNDSHNCVLIDLPNHGESMTLKGFSFSEVCKQLNELLSKLNIDKAHIIGHSLGGKIALHMSLEYPQKCFSVVAADIAPVEYPHRHQAVFDGLQNVDLQTTQSRQDGLKQLSEYVKEPPTQQFLLKGLYQVEGKWAWRFRVDELIQSYDVIRGWHDSVKAYSGPVLFVIGGNSDYVGAQHQQAIRAQFPNASAKIIQGTGHWLHAEKPQIFNRIVSQFVNAER
jgi:esterase